MLTTFLMSSLVALGGVPDDVLTVTAHVEIGRKPGRGDIVLEVKFKDGYASDKDGITHPILQIDVPASIKLQGRELTDYRSLSGNEFLNEPYERLVKDATTRIPFSTKRGADSGQAVIGLNILAYVTSTSGDGSWFVRKRLEIGTADGSKAKEVSATNSKWGKEPILHIGDKATTFALPRADGSTVSLDSYLGEKNIIVTTYRAFW